MPQKEYEIAFRLAASKAGSFSAAFNAAGQSVNSLSEQIAKMDEAASNLGGLIEAREKLSQAAKSSKSALLAFQGLREKSEELQKRTADLANEHADAEAELKKLERQIQNSANASDDLKAAYEAQKKKVADLDKEINRSVAELKNLGSATKVAEKQYEKTRKTVESQRASIARLDREMGTAGQSTTTLASRQKALADASAKATSRLQKQAEIQAKIDRIAGKRAGIESTGAAIGSAGKLIGRTATSAIVPSGGAVVSAGGTMLKMGSEYQAAINQMQAATGLSAEEMAKLEASARAIYLTGLGENFADVTRSMSIMRQVTGLTGKDLESATKNAILLSKTFDMDVNESARASSALMKNFGISGQKAYDLIAYAAQNGANKNGDLLDTLNEYAVHYQALGFTAEEFTAHLVQGAKDGSFSIDKVGDAMKEFNIRAKDGSQSSMEAFDMLGVNANVATQMFAKGGKDAQLAFMEIVKRIEAIEDPVKRNAIGVKLFGTQFEDLEAKALNGLSKIKTSAIDAKGTMDAIAELSTQDLGNQIRILSRQFQDYLTPAAKEASKSLSAQMPAIQKSMQAIAPYIEQLSKAFIDALPSIMKWATVIIQRTTEVGVWVAENFDKIAAAVSWAIKIFLGLKLAFGVTSGLMRVAETVLIVQKSFMGCQGVLAAFKAAILAVGGAMKLLATNPMTLTIAAIAALALAGNYIIKNWDEVSAKAQALYQSFKTNLVDAMAPVVTQFEAIGASVQAVFTNIIGFVQNIFTGQWAAAWENVKAIFANAFSALSGLVKTPFNAVIALVNSVIKSMNKIGSVEIPGVGKVGINIPEIPLLAQGGIAMKPTLATVAEGGEPEAIIPLSKLNQMLSPVAESGVLASPEVPKLNRLLDPSAMPPENSSLSRASTALFGPNSAALSPAGSESTPYGTPITINISPTINVQGADANPDGIAERIVDVLRQKLPGEMQRVLDRQSRLSFA